MSGKTARRIAALAAGLALDALMGDPHGWPHPVRFIGKQIEAEERVVRERILSKHPDCRSARIAGAGITATVALLAPTTAHLALKAAEKANPWLSAAAEAILFYQLVAARSLSDESMRVHDALEAGDVEEARGAVAMIVGRDTDVLDAEGIARAAVETVAENASDGVVAPMLAMALGGPNVYFGKVAEKPTIGDANRPVEPGDISRANRLMFATAALAVLVSAGLAVVSTSGMPARAMSAVLRK